MNDFHIVKPASGVRKNQLGVLFYRTVIACCVRELCQDRRGIELYIAWILNVITNGKSLFMLVFSTHLIVIYIYIITNMSLAVL